MSNGGQLKRGFVIYMIVMAVAFLAFAAYDWERDRAHGTQVEALLEAELGICERAKQDRVDNARAWTQAEKTWKVAAQRRGMPQKERDLTLETAILYGESANQLRSRLFECGPLIEHGIKIPDESALREAQGDI